MSFQIYISPSYKCNTYERRVLRARYMYVYTALNEPQPLLFLFPQKLSPLSITFVIYVEERFIQAQWIIVSWK